MKKNSSAPPGPIVPTLIYDDLARAIDWLCGAFGFKERLRISGPDGGVGHAQLVVGDGGIILGASRVGQSPGAGDPATFSQPRKNEVSIYLAVRVQDVDAHYEISRHFGAKIILPPTTHPYGERQYTAEDFAGYRWTFTQSVSDIKPEMWGATPLSDG